MVRLIVCKYLITWLWTAIFRRYPQSQHSSKKRAGRMDQVMQNAILQIVFCYVFPLDLSEWVFKILNKRAFFISRGGYNLIYFHLRKFSLASMSFIFLPVFVCNSISRLSVQNWWHFGTQDSIFSCSLVSQ